MAQVGESYQSVRSLTPGSVTVSWTIGASNYTLADQGDGTLAGSGTGTVDYATGDVRFKANPAPKASDGDYQVTITEWAGASKLTDSITPTQAQITKTVQGAPIKPGSLVVVGKMVRIREAIDYTKYQAGQTFDERRSYKFDGVAHDDGAGNLLRDGQAVGTVNYTTGEVIFDLRQSYQYQQLEQGIHDWSYRAYTQTAPTALEEYDTAVDVSFEYIAAADGTQVVNKAIPVPGVSLDLIPGTALPIIPGSLLFTFAGKTYRDRNGAIITDWSSTTDAGTNVGSIDYATGVVDLGEYPAGANLTQAPVILACLTWRGERTSYFSKFRTAGAPLRQGSLIINAVAEDGTEISTQAASDGSITHALITTGSVDTETGIVSIEWATPIYPTSLSYSAVAFTYLPLDPELLGLDPTRLPSDGRVPIFLPGDVGVFSHTIETAVASPVAGATLTFTRDHQAEVWVKGANGATLDPAQYTLNRETGVLTWADPLTLQDTEANPVTTPLTVSDRVEDMVLITDVQVSGQVGFNAQLSQTYPAGEATLSSAVLHGDLRARVFNLFHQASWTGAWSDERIGNDTTAKYNDVAYPIEITNQGSIQERWLIRFTSSTSFEVVGETVGVIGSGNTAADTAIANPATGAPYFTIRAGGWGSGWAAGNSVRFNTDGAQAPFWIARTILSGPATATEDSFATQNRGDAD